MTKFARAKFRYTPQNPGDLEVPKNAVIRVESVVVEGQWWMAQLLDGDGEDVNGSLGNVPMNYFQLLDKSPFVAKTEEAVPLASPAAPEGAIQPKPRSLPPRPTLAAVAPSPSSPSPSLGPGPPPPINMASRPTLAAATVPSASAIRRAPPAPPLSPSSFVATPATATTVPERKTWTRPATSPAAAPSTTTRQVLAPPTDPRATLTSASGEKNDEPIFTSLKDRMAALNGRGLSFSGSPAPPAPAPRDSPRQTSPPASASPRFDEQPAAGIPLPLCPRPPPLKPRPSASSASSSSSSSIPKMAAELGPSLPPAGPTKRPPPAPPRRMTGSSTPPEAHILPVTIPLPVTPAVPPRLPPRRSISSTPNVQKKPSPDTEAPPIMARRLPLRAPDDPSLCIPPPPPRRQVSLAPPEPLPKAPPRPATPPPLTFSLDYSSPQAEDLSDDSLAISSQWYAQRAKLTLPASISCRQMCRSSCSARFSSSSVDTSSLNLIIDYADRSRTSVYIEWGAGVPVSQPAVSQTHKGIPPPSTLEDLIFASNCYGERVALWCEDQEGSQVGRGECWDLADHAIKAVSENLVQESGGEFPGLSEAIQLSFGEVIFVNVEGVKAFGADQTIRRGDILQFKYCQFKSYFSDGSTMTSTAGTPSVGHTAVVTRDWTGAGGQEIEVLQANVQGSPLTRKGTYNLGDLVSGEVRAFRVMDLAWAEGDSGK